MKTGVFIVTFIAFLLVATAAEAQDVFWPDPVAHHVVAARTAGLTHGPVLGRPGATTTRVWIRTQQPTKFRVRYATHLPLDLKAAAVEAETTAAADMTGVADLTGLLPNTRYYYGIEIDGRLADTRLVFNDPWPSFRTLPNESTFLDEQFNPQGRFNVCFSIAVGGCQDPVKSGGQYSDPPGWHNMLNRHGDEIQFVLMNGDYTYEEARDGTETGVRANYKLYMERGRGMARLQRNVPWMFMYDDHEVEDNLFGSGEIGFNSPKRRYVHRDAQLTTWYEYAGWANPSSPWRGALILGEATVEAGSDVLQDPHADFSPLRPEQVSTVLVRQGKGNVGTYGVVKILDAHRLQIRPAFRSGGPVAYSVGTHHWFDWKLGNCHFFVIDTRGERSHFNAADLSDPDTFLLGETQRQWLIDGIRNSDADFVFVISTTGVIVPHTAHHVGGSTRSKGDGFPGYVHERERILNALDEIDKPIMFLTGDVHNSVSAQITDNIWEFMVSPLNSKGHPIGTLGNMPYSGWYTDSGRKAKIRWVAGWPNNVHYSRLASTLYAVIRVNNVLKTARPEGEGYQFVAYEYPQAIVTWYDAYTGRMRYSETVSTLDVAGELPAIAPD